MRREDPAALKALLLSANHRQFISHVRERGLSVDTGREYRSFLRSSRRKSAAANTTLNNKREELRKAYNALAGCEQSSQQSIEALFNLVQRQHDLDRAAAEAKAWFSAVLVDTARVRVFEFLNTRRSSVIEWDSTIESLICAALSTFHDAVHHQALVTAAESIPAIATAVLSGGAQ